MAINLGAAYIDIVPSTRGLGPQLQKQVVQPAAAAGDRAATGFGSRFSAGISSFLGGVSAVMERTLGAAALAGAGLATVTFAKGWDRLTTIQDATTSLTVTLGDAEEAASLLNQVLEVVRGTPFNLDQFASAAQRLSGMGIEAQKIPGYLTAIGEASALQGGRSGEFVDRLTRVFGQIQAQGRVMGQDILQISETGVNALAILGNAYGVTAEEMRDMISKGAVPAGEALDILAKGILNGSDGPAGATVALAGNMEALRQTLSGVTGGVGAAVARLGAGFLAPFTPALTDSLNGVIDFLDEITPKATEFSQAIVNSEGFASFTDWLSGLPDAISGGVQALGDLDGALGPILGLLASFASKGLSGLPLIGGLIPVIGPFVGIVGGIIAASPELRDSVGGLLDSLVRLGEALVTAFTPVVDTVLPAVEAILGLGLEGLTGAVDYVTGLVTAFNESGLGGVWDTIAADWESAGPTITTSLDTAWSAVSGWVAQKAEEAPGIIGGLADSITEGFDSALNGDAENPPFLDSLERGFSYLDYATAEQQKHLEENIRTTWPEAFTTWVDAVINGDENGPGIVDRVQGITDAIDQWIDEGGVQQLAAGGAKLFGALLKGWVTVMVPGIIKMIQGLIVAFFKAIAALAWMFIQIGGSIAASIIDGIESFLTEKLPGVLKSTLESGLKISFPGAGLAEKGLDLFRASGGPVSFGQGYVVGENGPEWFQPGANGFITPNRIFSQLTNYRPAETVAPTYMTAGGGNTWHVTAPSTDANDIVRASQRAARKQSVLAGGIGG